jgi:hypothetical protein
VIRDLPRISSLCSPKDELDAFFMYFKTYIFILFTCISFCFERCTIFHVHLFTSLRLATSVSSWWAIMCGLGDP